MTLKQQHQVLKLLECAKEALEEAAGLLTVEECRATCLDLARTRVNHCLILLVEHRRVTP